ncbi:MAG: ferritin family protein [Clostridia bacterium]
MTRRFNDLEGLRIAVEMEKRGADLYRHAVRISKSPKAARVLAQLEADEREHQRNFSLLHEAQLARYEGDAGIVWYDGESSAFLSAMAAEVVFSDGLVGMARKAGFDEPTEIVRYAAQTEKDSILFYDAILAQTGDPEAHRVFSEIIRQEKEHLQKLTQLLMEEEA